MSTQLDYSNINEEGNDDKDENRSHNEEDLLFMQQLFAKCNKNTLKNNLNPTKTSSQLFCPMEFTYENMFGHTDEKTEAPPTETPKIIKPACNLPKIVINPKDKNYLSKILEVLSCRTEEIMKKISLMDVNIKQLRIFKEAAQTSEICQYCKLFFDELTRQKKEISDIVETLKGCVNSVPLNLNNFQDQIETLTSGIHSMLHDKKEPVILQNTSTSPTASEQFLRPTVPSLNISNNSANSQSSEFRRPVNIINEIHYKNESDFYTNNSKSNQSNIDGISFNPENVSHFPNHLIDKTQSSNMKIFTENKVVFPDKAKSLQNGIQTFGNYIVANAKIIKTDKNCDHIPEKLVRFRDGDVSSLEENMQLKSSHLIVSKKNEDTSINELYRGPLKCQIGDENTNSDFRCDCSLLFTDVCDMCKDNEGNANKNCQYCDEKWDRKKWAKEDIDIKKENQVSYHCWPEQEELPNIPDKKNENDIIPVENSLENASVDSISSKKPNNTKIYLLKNIKPSREACKINDSSFGKSLNSESKKEENIDNQLPDDPKTSDSQENKNVIWRKNENNSSNNIIHQNVNKNYHVLSTVAEKNSELSKLNYFINSPNISIQTVQSNSNKKLTQIDTQFHETINSKNTSDEKIPSSFKDSNYKSVLKKTSKTIKLDDEKIDKLRSILQMNAKNEHHIENCNDITETHKLSNASFESNKSIDSKKLAKENKTLSNNSIRQNISKGLQATESVNDTCFILPQKKIINEQYQKYITENNKTFLEKSCLCKLCYCNEKASNFTNQLSKFINISPPNQCSDYANYKTISNDFVQNNLNVNTGTTNDRLNISNLDNVIQENVILDKIYTSSKDTSSSTQENKLRKKKAKKLNVQKSKKITPDNPSKTHKVDKEDIVFYIPEAVCFKTHSSNKKSKPIIESNCQSNTAEDITEEKSSSTKITDTTSSSNKSTEKSSVFTKRSKITFFIPKKVLKKCVAPSEDNTQSSSNDEKCLVIVEKKQKSDEKDKYKRGINNKITVDLQNGIDATKPLTESTPNQTTECYNWTSDFLSVSDMFSQTSSDKLGSEGIDNFAKPLNQYVYCNRSPKNLDILYNLDTEPCKLKFNYESVSLFEQPIFEPEVVKDNVKNYRKNFTIASTMTNTETKYLKTIFTETSSASEYENEHSKDIKSNISLSSSMPRPQMKNGKYILCVSNSINDMERLKGLGLQPMDVTGKIVKSSKGNNTEKNITKGHKSLNKPKSILNLLKSYRKIKVDPHLQEKDVDKLFTCSCHNPQRQIEDDVAQMMQYLNLENQVQNSENATEHYSENTKNLMDKPETPKKDRFAILKKFFSRYKK